MLSGRLSAADPPRLPPHSNLMSPPRVLVTGGSRGIGRAIALHFARHGCPVAIAARNSTQLDLVVTEIDQAGGKGFALQMDVREHGAVEGAVYRALEFHGGILDVLVNGAGVWDLKSFEKTDPTTWRRVIEVNLFGPYFVTRDALDGLLESERAHIFNIASQAARQGLSGNTAYCASKYGLRGFGDALRVELKERGVRVSTVYPGATDTSLFDNVPGQWDRSKMNRPEDVATVVWDAYHAPDTVDVDDLDVPPPR
jgi:NAD(P)-dependent dehydrogenase (short-subunit alcohol dehydrogenase family)